MFIANVQSASTGGRQRTKQSWLGALVAIVLLATACGSTAEPVTTSAGSGDPATEDATSEPDASPTSESTEEVIDDGGAPVNIDVETLTAGTWTLMFGGGPEGDVQLVDGYPITITFDGDGSFGGTAACNDYGGTYDVDGPQIFFGEIGWQEMGCEPDVQAAEGAFLAALLDSVDVNVMPEELALSGPSSELIFTPGNLVSLEPLWGRSFVLEAILIDGATMPVGTSGGDDVVLSINPDNTFVATTGCRTLEGTLVEYGSGIQVPESRADGDCPSGLVDQSNHIIGVLGDSFTFEHDGGQLLISSAGNQGLQYRDTTEDAVVDAPDEVEGDSN